VDEPKNIAHIWQTTTTGLKASVCHILLTNSNFLQKTSIRRNQLSAETIMQLVTYAANTKQLVHPRVYDNFMFETACIEMEFLDINLTKDSSLLLNVT
jgi:hypothetical protein